MTNRILRQKWENTATLKRLFEMKIEQCSSIIPLPLPCVGGEIVGAAVSSCFSEKHSVGRSPANQFCKNKQKRLYGQI